MTHNFRTHTWKKQNQNGADHFKFLMNSTNAQRSFLHELASQQLGNPPSNMWGVPMPHEFHHPAEPATLRFVMHATKQPAPECGRLLSEHRKGSGWASAIGDIIGDAGKTSIKYIGKVGKFVAKNGTAIKNGAQIVNNLVQTGSTIAQLAGMIHPDTKSTIDSISDAVNKHVQGDHYKTKPKRGGRMGRILI